MPGDRVRVTATTADALASRRIREVPVPSILNVWAAGVTGTDDISILIGNQQILPPVDINIEASADIIDIDRDQLLMNELIPAGILSMPCTVTTELQVLISVKPV